MKGVIAMRAPGIPVVDVSHGIPAQNVMAGALVLRAAAPYFPAGTVHVAVVDPGVGTARRAICIATASARFVGPDNGLLTLAAPPAAAKRIVEITNDRHLLWPRSRTFHGRDVFAPAAAALAMGVAVDELGPDVGEVVSLGVPAPARDGNWLRGQVVYVDAFGNLATNIEAVSLPATVARVEIAGRRIDGVVATYGAVPAGELLALVNSWGVLEIARRDGDARTLLGADVGAAVTVVGG
jgi:S-adenosyl-L-methionine hydrolase (adenosine-forming)